MSRRMSNAFLKIVEEVLRNPFGRHIEISRSSLLSFTIDERDFLERFVRRYRRGSHVLRPKSMRHFLLNRKYESSDTVEIYLNIHNLKEAGYVEIVEKDGFYYWSVEDRILDPREFEMLYKTDEKTFRTLMKEYGYLELYDTFKNIIKPYSGDFYTLAEFTLEGLSFIIYRDSLYASLYISPPYEEHKDIVAEPYPGYMYISVRVGKPTVENVHRVIEHVKELRKAAAEEANKLRKHILRETGIDIPPYKFEVRVSSENYEIKSFDISVSTRRTTGRKSIYIYINWRKADKTFFVVISSKIISGHVCKVFDSIDLKELGVQFPHPYALSTSWADRSVELEYRHMLDNVDDLPPLSDHYEYVSKIERHLLEIPMIWLDRKKEQVIHEYRDHKKLDTGLKVGDIVSALGWNPDADLDEIVVKLIAAKTVLPAKSDPDVFNILVASTTLRRLGSQPDIYKKIMEKVDKGIETIMKYISSGRLSTGYEETPAGKVQRIYLDGRDLGIDLERLHNFRIMIRAARFLLTPIKDEETHKNRYIPISAGA